MEYDFRVIEQNWKKYWNEQQVYEVSNQSDKPKFYILDMFPYPSGAGLHVGHPLGYIASDIYARYKRLKGYNVLHPMGYDAFGLPAEQYAMGTGQHPAVTTEKNIARYREQLDNIGFSYDWSRKVRTSDPKYYKWTQWMFLQLFHSWYDRAQNKARPIEELIAIFKQEGNTNTPCPEDETLRFDAAKWNSYTEKQQRDILMQYRLAYLSYAEVWWCEGLGTVLANDEVVNGVSERGGFPVVKKRMHQWFLRITEYADRLLQSLDTLEWSDAMKEMQRNWIGRSNGAEIRFSISGHNEQITVFTTRPDTIFGVDFMVLAPEHELVETIASEAQREAVNEYKQYVQSRSERERMAEVKQVTGCFTGAYALHPFTQKQIPIWISEYVLAGYGTGAIMAVPSGDERDHTFAQHFNLPITNIFGDKYNGTEAYAEKTGILHNSDFLTGLEIKEAAEKAIQAVVKAGIGKAKINYKLRDAGFSRQRYWGEPFPVIYIDDVPYATDESIFDKYPDLQQLPVELPTVDSYKPGPEGQGPLANISEWVNTPAGRRETSTMPGYAGSSWYFLRYMDPHNDDVFADRAAMDYWKQVDIYIGGTEHAVGHLLYSRMWTKFLHDRGYISFDEPFKKLINQGMIQGNSYFAQSIPAIDIKERTYTSFIFSNNIIELNKLTGKLGITQDLNAPGNYRFNWQGRDYEIQLLQSIPLRIRNAHLFIDTKNRITKSGLKETFIMENISDEKIEDILSRVIWDGKNENGEEYLQCEHEIEKMSKSKYNVVNPDIIVTQYGADTFRMYEMFLGPIDVSKPWDTKGIEGVHRFLKKMWRLYFDEQKGLIVTDEAPTEQELRIVHKTIKKVSEDIERFAFNTAVSQFMICVNELASLSCHKRAILEPLAVLICPFAPHMAEELWHQLGHTDSVVAHAAYPAYEEKYVTENTKKYPVAVNGKTRIEMEFPLDAAQEVVEREVLADETIQKWLEGKEPKKVIYVKGRMINVVV